MTLTAFEPEAILSALEREGVRYIVIGGLAAVLHGSPLLTQDVDICPANDAENLKRLAKALKSIGAKIRTDDVPDGLPFACDPQFFQNVSLVNLTTIHGDVDVSFTPSGTTGFDDLAQRARPLEIAPHLAPPIADLEDVIRSKRAANRPKDVAALPTLLTLLAETKRRAINPKD
jgi:hypothetical protein